MRLSVGPGQSRGKFAQRGLDEADGEYALGAVQVPIRANLLLSGKHPDVAVGHRVAVVRLLVQGRAQGRAISALMPDDLRAKVLWRYA